MKKVLLANNDKPVNQAIKNSGRCEVVKVVPYLNSLIKIVEQLKPQTVVLSPYLPGGKEDPRDVMHELSMLNDAPQIILLAGNLEKKDELIEFAVSCEIRDIVFNPAPSVTDDVIDFMVSEILNRIEHPRNRKQILQELGIAQRKHLPSVTFDEWNERETNRRPQPEGTQAPNVPAAAAAAPSPAPAAAQGHAPYGNVLHAPPPVHKHRPYLVGVLSPASAGASFIAQNVAAAMALADYDTALFDMDDKRTQHYLFGREPRNRSFFDLFDRGIIEGEGTVIQRLSAYTSAPDGHYHGDVGWIDTITALHYELAVLDFSSGRAWRRDLLFKALARCDEILFVSDMDYSKAQQSRDLLDRLSQLTVPIRLVLNRWIPEHQPCEITELAPVPPAYYVPFYPESCQAVVYGRPLADWMPEVRDKFWLKGLEGR